MFGMGGKADGPGWDGTEVRGGATSGRESSGLREIRGGRPQRMRVWILRFTNGPASSGGYYVKEKTRSTISRLSPPKLC